MAVPESCQKYGLFGGLSAHERDSSPGTCHAVNVVIFFDSKCKAEIAQTFQVNLEGAVALHEEWAPVNSDRAQGDKTLLCNRNVAPVIQIPPRWTRT